MYRGELLYRQIFLLLNSEMSLSSAKKSEVRKIGENGLKQAENRWKYPNLGKKKKKNLISD